MRILQLVTRRQHRGAEVFAAQLGDALVQRGHQVVLAGLYAPPPNPLTPGAAATADLLDASSVGRLSPRAVGRVADFVRTGEFDLVQANGSDTLKYTALARRLRAGRWPLVYRNISLASYWLRYPGQRAWGRWLLRAVDHVAAVSEQSREDFRRTYAVPESRISTLPIGVHIPERPHREEARRRLLELAGVPADAEILAHIGSFSPEKNHLWLLESFVEIRRERPAVHLLLFGDGPLLPTVRAAVAEHGLEPSVHLLGRHADVSELVAGAELLVLPSRIEGIPGVILEAAAQGVPAVATAVGAMHEAVRDGETGVLVPLDDRPAFVGAVSGLLADPRRRRQMGVAARAYVTESFGMERVVDAFERLYEQLARNAW